MSLDAIGVARRVADALESVGIDYVIGGSLASSFVGEPRSTLDVDIVVRLTEAQIDPLVECLGDDFFVDPLSLRRAVRDGTSANLIHAGSAFKVDLFMLGAQAFEQGQITRRRRVRVSVEDDVHLYFSAPEDVIVQKLRWYRLGGEVSDRQWRDVVAVLRHSAAALDRPLIEEGARALRVEDLLRRAEADAREG